MAWLRSHQGSAARPVVDTVRHLSQGTQDTLEGPMCPPPASPRVWKKLCGACSWEGTGKQIPLPEAPSLCSSLPLTPDKREIPKWEPFKTRSTMGKPPFVCMGVRGMPAAGPCLTRFADKAHSGWGGSEEPGHSAARTSLDQRGPTVLPAELTHLFPIHPHPCLRTVSSRGSVHSQASSLGPWVSFLTNRNRNHQLNRSVGLGPTDLACRGAGGHLGLVTGGGGGLEMLDAAPD